ncbi:unnamed protein product [Closterium sp. NIES-54]
MACRRRAPDRRARLSAATGRAVSSYCDLSLLRNLPALLLLPSRPTLLRSHHALLLLPSDPTLLRSRPALLLLHSCPKILHSRPTFLLMHSCPTLLRRRSALLLLDSPIVPRRLLLDMHHPLVHPLPERHSVLLRTLRPTWMFSFTLAVLLDRLIARARAEARFRARALLLVRIAARAAHLALSLPRCILLKLLLLLVDVLNHDVRRPLASSPVFGTPSRSYSLRHLVFSFSKTV